MAKAATEKPTVNTIIRDAAVLEAGIVQFKSKSENFHREMHVLAVSALVHTAEHGNPALLNRLFGESMPAAYQTSFKLYVNRIMHPKGNNIGKLFDFEKGLFSILKDTNDKRAAFIKLAEAELINGKPFYDRDPIREQRLFGNAEVLARIDGIIKLIEKGDTDTVDVAVTDDIADILRAARIDIERVSGLGPKDNKRARGATTEAGATAH